MQGIIFDWMQDQKKKKTESKRENSNKIGIFTTIGKFECVLCI